MSVGGNRAWTEREDEIMRHEWANPDIRMAEIGAMLDRSVNAVRFRGEKFLNLGPKATSRIAWDDAKREQLRELWADPTVSAKQIAEAMGVPRNSVLGKAHLMGLPTRVTGRKAVAIDRPAQRPTPWTDETVAELRHLWDHGKSATQIAQTIGGISRNAVITKANRLGLTRDQATKAHNVKLLHPSGAGLRSATKLVPVAPLALAGDAGAETPLPKISADVWQPLRGVPPVSIIRLGSRQCKWPVEVEGADFPHCCGALAVGGPYCISHAKIARPPATAAKPKSGNDLIRSLRRWAAA